MKVHLVQNLSHDPRDSTRRIFNATGYYSSSDSAFYYNLTDHLGNICAVVNATADSVVQRTMYYASGVPMSQSIGRDVQPYLYNGKEFVGAHGLNEYDSQARRYYATIMRTTTMDPLAENYYHISPYAWCGNNPINLVDLDGKAWKNIKDETTALGVLPMIIAHTSLWMPMGVVICFGTIFTLPLTLTVLPVLYARLIK